jgi:hypothetical protein
VRENSKLVVVLGSVSVRYLVREHFEMVVVLEIVPENSMRETMMGSAPVQPLEIMMDCGGGGGVESKRRPSTFDHFGNS